MPAKYFWSLIVYDAETLAFIYTSQNRQGLSSFDWAGMKTNPDGSVTLYFGPRPLPGLENNWIPTAGKCRRLAMYIHHTDAVREFAYDRKSRIGHPLPGARLRGRKQLADCRHETGLAGRHPAKKSAGD